MYGRNQRPDPNVFSLIYAIIPAVPAVIFGYTLGMLFGSQEEVSEFFIEATNRTSVIVGTFVLGFIFGVFISGYISYGSGRKITILSSAATGTLSVIAVVVAPGFTVQLCSFFVTGFAFGMYVVPLLMYISEIMSKRYRTTALMIPAFCLLLGFELSLLTGSNKSIYNILIYSVLVVINTVIITVGTIKMPESPRFLALSGSTDAALSVLFRLRSDMGSAARELAEINESCRGENRGFELFLQSNVYRQLLSLLGICLLLFCVSGSAVIPYMTADRLSYRIVCDYDFCYFDVNKRLLNISFTVLLMSVPFITLCMLRYGRKKTLVSTLSCSAASLFLTTLCSVLPESYMQSLCFIGSLLLCSFFSAGSCIAFLCVISVELMPIRGREFGTSTVCLCLGIGVLFSLHMYRPLINLLDFTGYFLSSSLAAVILGYLIYTMLPEDTTDKSLEEIEMSVRAAETVYELTLTEAERTAHRHRG